MLPGFACSQQQPVALQALQVHAHPVGVQAELLSQLDGAGRPPKFANSRARVGWESASSGPISIGGSIIKPFDTGALGKTSEAARFFSPLWVKNKEGARTDLRDTEPCIGTKGNSHVEVCPVDAIFVQDQVPTE